MSKTRRVIAVIDFFAPEVENAPYSDIAARISEALDYGNDEPDVVCFSDIDEFIFPILRQLDAYEVGWVDYRECDDAENPFDKGSLDHDAWQLGWSEHHAVLPPSPRNMPFVNV